jgi:acetone carboxylase gamma subunit
MDWIYVAQDRIHWQAGVIMIMEGRKFIDQLNDHQLLKGDCTPWC